MRKRAECPYSGLRKNICIALAYFLTNSHPSVCAPFVLLQTFCAWAQYSRCPYRQVKLLPSQCSQQTAVVVSFVWMSKELKRSLEMWVLWASEWRRGKQSNLCNTLPAQSLHSQEIEIWVLCPGSASDSQTQLCCTSMRILKPVCRLLRLSNIQIF